MKIDAHQHFWHYAPETHGWITERMGVLKRDFLPRDLEAERIACGVIGSVAVQAEQSERETDFLLGLAECDRSIAGVVGWLDFRGRDICERLERYSKRERLVGFRHLVEFEADDDFLLREDFLRGIAHLERYGFTYDIVIFPRHLANAVKFVEKFPAQRFAVDHLAKPEIRSGRVSMEWRDGIAALAAHPNVYCKLSGMVTEADWVNWRADDFTPYLDAVVGAFGVERVMFGSDWPVCLVAATYAQVLGIVEAYAGRFSANEREKIFCENAARFYGLEIPAHGSAA
jgi:L-fucono-1,5-lactonase